MNTRKAVTPFLAALAVALPEIPVLMFVGPAWFPMLYFFILIPNLPAMLVLSFLRCNRFWHCLVAGATGGLAFGLLLASFGSNPNPDDPLIGTLFATVNGILVLCTFWVIDRFWSWLDPNSPT